MRPSSNALIRSDNSMSADNPKCLSMSLRVTIGRSFIVLGLCLSVPFGSICVTFDIHLVVKHKTPLDPLKLPLLKLPLLLLTNITNIKLQQWRSTDSSKQLHI